MPSALELPPPPLLIASGCCSAAISDAALLRLLTGKDRVTAMAVADEADDPDPVLPLRLSVAGDEQPEAMNDDELDDEST